MKKFQIKAFTLAEIMIVLLVIGILTAILLPSAWHSVPDENIMKFKKANATLYRVINELVTSDKYYCNGDLGLKADCTTGLINSDGKREYFCQTIADQLSTKSVNCRTDAAGGRDFMLLSYEVLGNIATGSAMKRTVTSETIASAKAYFDLACKSKANVIGAEIITTDDVVYFQAGVTNQFHSQYVTPNANNGLSSAITLRYFSPPNQYPANYGDQNGFDIAYKVYCIDVDGIPDSATSDDCVNECPFGYGIRADGKIMTGARADDWLQKSVQNKD